MVQISLLAIYFFLIFLLQSSRIQATPTTQGEHNFNVLLKDLSPSAQSSIILPENTEKFTNATNRFTSIALPDISAVITPSNVRDVEKVVSYAHKYSIPIVTRTSGHGWVISIREVKRGIQLNLRPTFDYIKRIDATTLEIGGGTINEDLTDYLYKHNLRTAHGGCGCVGWMGLALGGGIGKYAGQFGLVTDVLQSLNIVTPSSGKLQIASSRSQKDLFWALRGAGANFGVVTSARVKVQPLELSNKEDDPLADRNEYTLWEYYFPITSIETVTAAVEKWRQTDAFPQAVIYLALFPANDASAQNISQPTINLSMQYWGYLEEALQAPFDALNPLVRIVKKSRWDEVSKALNMDKNAAGCAPNGMHIHKGHYPAQISHLDAASIRATYEMAESTAWPWVKRTKNGKATFQWKVFSRRVVSSISNEETAIPWRDRPITTVVTIWNSADSAVEVAEEGVRIGEEGRRLQNVERDLRVYINYAYGDEGEVASYGGGKRLEKLKRLKRRYDPKEIFSGFMPIRI